MIVQCTYFRLAPRIHEDEYVVDTDANQHIQAYEVEKWEALESEDMCIDSVCSWE